MLLRDLIFWSAPADSNLSEVYIDTIYAIKKKSSIQEFRSLLLFDMDSARVTNLNNSMAIAIFIHTFIDALLSLF